MRKKTQGFWKKSIRLLLLVFSLVYILYFFIRNKSTLQITFTMDWKTLSAILVLQVIFLVLQSWRFQIVIQKCAQAGLPFRGWLKIFILGRFLNLLFSQLGNVYRGVRVKQDYGISYTRYISGFASMAWLDTLMNLGFAVLIVVLLEPSLRIGQFAAWRILVALLLSFLLGPVVLDALFGKIKPTHPKLRWVHSKLSEVLCVSVNNLRDIPFLCKLFGLGLINFIRTIYVFHIYMSVFGTSASLAALTIFYTLFKMSYFVILTPGNLGIQELAWGFLSEQMGIGMGLGILMSGFVRIISTTMTILLGVGFGGLDILRHLKEYRQIQQSDSQDV